MDKLIEVDEIDPDVMLAPDIVGGFVKVADVMLAKVIVVPPTPLEKLQGDVKVLIPAIDCAPEITTGKSVRPLTFPKLVGVTVKEFAVIFPVTLTEPFKLRLEAEIQFIVPESLTVPVNTVEPLLVPFVFEILDKVPLMVLICVCGSLVNACVKADK